MNQKDIEILADQFQIFGTVENIQAFAQALLKKNKRNDEQPIFDANRDAYMVDAERYRWLKSHCFDTEAAGEGDAFGHPALHFESEHLQCYHAQSLDTAIDYELSKDQGEE